MAFVVKSKKGFEIKIGETNDIGPGEYLAQTNLREIKKSKAAFLTKIARDDFKSNEVPGPGAYYQDQTQINFESNMKREKMLCQNDKDQVMVTKGNDSIFLKNNVERLGFLQKEKRFKYNQNPQPGPGCYFPALTPKPVNYYKPQVSSENKKMQKLQMIKQEAIIPSIPVNNQVFGFDISVNGQLIRKINPDMYRTFSGEKGDTVGPGSYELDYPNKWHKTGTEWSKMKTARKNEENKDIEKNDENQKKWQDQQGISVRTTGYSENKHGATKISFMKCKIVKTRTSRMKQEDSDIDQEKGANSARAVTPNIDMKHFPGPGYYFDMDKRSAFRIHKCPEFKQFFGSKMERFQQPKGNSQISPATYFTDEEGSLKQKEYLPHPVNNNAAFSTKTDRFFNSNIKESQPGPGQYNPPEIFNKTKKSDEDQYSKFGSTEKRFSQTSRFMKGQINSPGPGAYIDPFSNTGTFNTFKWKGMLLNINKAKTFMRHNQPLSIRSKSQESSIRSFVPPVGQYNPEMIYTIDYKIQKKKAKNCSDEVAFNSGLSKGKKLEKQKGNIGPGYYYKDKKKEIKEGAVPFNHSEMRKMGFVGKGKGIGPGDYHSDSYFDWNKKTYNINYI